MRLSALCWRSWLSFLAIPKEGEIREVPSDPRPSQSRGFALRNLIPSFRFGGLAMIVFSVLVHVKANLQGKQIRK
ncbi:hypothetical protein J5N97_003729 [Dioscorea zingiberensis]|uniref:Uncharacterized protein n=1 Tax=Dioscorea zingiberensis TaxID=325984 RepID=A0A9D5D751_9LILI|nr:hypothetical protein J5N97_003729 [Dioscorea zingiberensis]